MLTQIAEFIKGIGLYSFMVLVGLLFIGIAFIDISRSEGKLAANLREKYPRPLVTIGGLLVVIGLGLGIFVLPEDTSSLIEVATQSKLTLEALTATLGANKAQLSAAIDREENAITSVASLQEELELARDSAGDAEATMSYLQNQMATAEGRDANAIATLDTLQIQLTSLQEDLDNAQATSVNLTPFVTIVTATPQPPLTPPEFLQFAIENAFLSAAKKLEKPAEARTQLSDVFLKEARIRLDSEIGTYQNFFSRIEEPTWNITIERTEKDERLEVYSLYVKHTLRFTGYYRCPGIAGEKNEPFEVQYGASGVRESTIRAEIQQVDRQQVRVYSVILGDAGDQLIDSIRMSCPTPTPTLNPMPTPTSTPTPTP